MYILSFDHTWIICLHEFDCAVRNSREVTPLIQLRPTDPSHLMEYKNNFAAVFDASMNGNSLRKVLQSTKLGQLWFDVRGDADALYKHHGITLGHVMDIQLLELVCRFGYRSQVSGLLFVVKTYGEKFMHKKDKDAWLRAKKRGKDFFNDIPEGINPLKWKVLEQVPLPRIVMNYTAGDVEILFKLYEYFIPRLELMSRYLEHPNMLPLLHIIDDTSQKRAFDSTTDEYDPRAEGKNTAPIPPADLEYVGPAGRLSREAPPGTAWLEDPSALLGAFKDGTYKNPYQTFTMVHGKYHGEKTLKYDCKIDKVKKMRRPITWIPPDSVLAALAALVSITRHIIPTWFLQLLERSVL